jgi:hypothetical protein
MTILQIKKSTNNLSLLPFIIHCPILIFLVIVLKKRYQNEPLVAFFTWAFCAKILAGVAYGWLYVVYYGGIGDSLGFFRDSTILANFAYQNWADFMQLVFFDQYFLLYGLNEDLWVQPRAFWMVKLMTFLNLLAGGNYWVMGFYLSFLSFWGMWKLANSLTKLYPRAKLAAVFAFLFFPSTLLWSAGLSKESLIMATIGLSLAKVIDFVRKPSLFRRKWLRSLLIWLISIVLLSVLKYHYLVTLLPCVGLLGLGIWAYNYLKISRYAIYFSQTWQQLAGLSALSLALLIIGLAFTPSSMIEYFEIMLVHTHNVIYIFSEPEDLIHFSIYPYQGYINLHTHWLNFVYNFPLAVFSGFFRPFLWEAGDNKLKLILGLEGLGVLFLTFYALIYFFRQPIKDSNYLKINALLFFFTFIYLILLFSLLAYSTPNFGTLARYRVAGYPFFIYLISFRLSEHIEVFWYKWRGKVNELNL